MAVEALVRQLAMQLARIGCGIRGGFNDGRPRWWSAAAGDGAEVARQTTIQWFWTAPCPVADMCGAVRVIVPADVFVLVSCWTERDVR